MGTGLRMFHIVWMRACCKEIYLLVRGLAHVNIVHSSRNSYTSFDGENIVFLHMDPQWQEWGFCSRSPPLIYQPSDLGLLVATPLSLSLSKLPPWEIHIQSNSSTSAVSWLTALHLQASKALHVLDRGSGMFPTITVFRWSLRQFNRTQTFTGATDLKSQQFPISQVW